MEQVEYTIMPPTSSSIAARIAIRSWMLRPRVSRHPRRSHRGIPVQADGKVGVPALPHVGRLAHGAVAAARHVTQDAVEPQLPLHLRRVSAAAAAPQQSKHTPGRRRWAAG
jgi:hypothetical protein